MRSDWRSEQGTVTAEFALVLPLVVLVLFLALGALSLLSMQVIDSVVVTDLSRMLSRGASAQNVITELARLRPAAYGSIAGDGGTLCLQLSEPVSLPLWSVVIPDVRVSACVPIP